MIGGHGRKPFVILFFVNFCDYKRGSMKRNPNIVFILADDLGYGDLGLYGNETVRTPCLDRLGRAGLVLTQHYTASPLCAPARAALLTGQYNHRTGAVDVPSNRGLDRIALAAETVADVLKRAGYATGMVGKWHNGLHDARYHPNARGFSEFVGFLNGGMDYYRWVVDRNGRPEPSDGRYLTDVFTSEACDFVRRHRAEPFFLYLAYNAPHAPYQAPDDVIERYRKIGGLTENVCRLYAMVECMDRGIGRVLRELEAQALVQDTIIVFTSDNGPFLSGDLERYNGPLRGAKGDVLEGGIRVPCLVSWPGALPGGAEIAETTHFCDWLPTLTSLAECPLRGAGPRDGLDMAPLLRREGRTVERPRYWQRNRYAPIARCNGAMRDGPWKLVWPMREGANRKDEEDNRFYHEGLTTPHRFMPVTSELPRFAIGPAAKPQLFRIDADPREERDLAAEQPARLDVMVRAWDAWFAETTQPWPATFARNTRPPP
jgi:arylsulfatase A-like enzyme